MLRPLAVVSGIAVVALISFSCANVVALDAGFFPTQLDTGEVHVIDARSMQRTGVERVLDEHYVIGRFDVSIPVGDDFEQRLLEQVTKATPRVLQSGGRVLMYTDNSELIAVIKHDARYAGALGAITMYVLLRRM